MKRNLLVALPVALPVALALVLAFVAVQSNRSSVPVVAVPTPVGEVVVTAPSPGGPDSSRPMSGPDRERWFFDDWHGEDHGTVLDAETLDSIWAEIDALQAPASRQADQWVLVGPSGMDTDSGSVYSGRILDIAEYDGGNIFWVAAASGGLWVYDGGEFTPLTDSLATLAVGTVSVDPNENDNLVIGTGEWRVRAGSGIFRTTDKGATWAQSVSAPAGAIFHRIRHVDSNVLIGISDMGAHRSSDGGATWTLIRGGLHFDLSLDPFDPTIAYSTWWQGPNVSRVIKTTDGGQSWSFTGLQVTGYRGSVATGDKSIDPSHTTVYAAFCEEDAGGSVLDGIYKSTNAGLTWVTVLPGAGNNYMGGQGWYNNVIAVHPYFDEAIAGGVDLVGTFDGGTTWLDIDSGAANNLHADYHHLNWFPGSFAPTLFLGHDGGFSFDINGDGFLMPFNDLPITQYTHVHASRDDLLTLAGGSQDNGISVTTDGGATWYWRLLGDGSDVSIDPNDSNRIWAVRGVYSTPPSFRREISTDQGQNWTLKNNGIAASTDWWTEIANDQLDPVWLYTNAGMFVYESQDYADNWTALGSFTADVRNLEVGRWSSPKAGVYATLDSDVTGNRVWIYDAGTWFQRDAGLPMGRAIRAVVGHPTDPLTCFALVNGIGTPLSKVFSSTDRGATWLNITGDLPDVPLGAIVAHPTDPQTIYLGTEMGCFKTSNGGVNWQTWNTGMPRATIVCDMTYVDRLASHGEFYVIAGTYGRSMYRREISGIEPTAIAALDVRGLSVQLAQNAPNPHRGNTRISFSLPKEGHARLVVYDVAGREVATLVDEVMSAGAHEAEFRSANLAPGAYFYRLEANGESRSRKMIIVR